MKVAGFTIIRNAIRYDYPVAEAIASILPLCDIFYVGVGDSGDGTRELIAALAPEKIRIVDSKWDDTLREGGQVLAQETNKVFDAIPAEYDWCFYLQSDECVHEADLPRIEAAMRENLDNPDIDGLLFEYRHFYGHYGWIGIGRRWYQHEIRIVKNNKRIRSYKDAQGFRTADGRKLRVKDTGAFIYHYGWVKPPQAQQAKQENFHKMWHDDRWVSKHVAPAQEFDYGNIDLLGRYTGTHPAVMAERMARAGWAFDYDPRKARMSLKYKLLYLVEKLTGWRIGENRNYLKK
jgi:hypothetical protein